MTRLAKKIRRKGFWPYSFTKMAPKLSIIVRQPKELIFFFLFLLIPTSLGLARPDKPPKNIICDGWYDLCLSLYADEVGPFRVNETLFIDCYGAFDRSYFPAHYSFDFTYWNLPGINGTNRGNGSFQLENAQESDSGDYTCFINVSPINQSTSLTWPIKVYRPLSDHRDTILIWILNGVIAIIVMVLISFYQQLLDPRYITKKRNAKKNLQQQS